MKGKYHQNEQTLYKEENVLHFILRVETVEQYGLGVKIVSIVKG